MFRKLFAIVMPPDPAMRRAEVHRKVLREYAREGGKVFGEVPAGVRREFFCLDPQTWVWHEEWDDANHQHHARTTRYDVRPHGLFKAQDGQPYQPVSYEEALRLQAAAHQYVQMMDSRLTSLTAVR